MVIHLGTLLLLKAHQMVQVHFVVFHLVGEESSRVRDTLQGDKDTHRLFIQLPLSFLPYSSRPIPGVTKLGSQEVKCILCVSSIGCQFSLYFFQFTHKYQGNGILGDGIDLIDCRLNSTLVLNEVGIKGPVWRGALVGHCVRSCPCASVSGSSNAPSGQRVLSEWFPEIVRVDGGGGDNLLGDGIFKTGGAPSSKGASNWSEGLRINW